MNRTTLLLPFALVCSQLFAQGDPGTLDRIIEQGKYHNQVMSRLHELCFDIGPRVTGSPKLAKAQKWAMGKFKSWGLTNIHLEQWGEVPVGFERGDHQVGRMVEPYDVPISFTTMNWMPGTNGLIRANAVMAPQTMADFERDKAKLKGAWVVYYADTGMHGPDKKEPADIKKALDDLGIAGRIYGTKDTRVWSHGSYKGKTIDKHPTDVQIVVSRPDYDRIVRNIGFGRKTVLEFQAENLWFKGPIPQYNVVAEIKGTEKPEEVVIVCGHLDSWNSPGSQGANDNGTGTVTAMEAARILSAAHAKPKRTIRFILWSGEEQGLLGSTAYVKNHEAEWDKISAVLNDDDGSNYQSGYWGYAVMKPMLVEAYQPTVKAFPDMPQHFDVYTDMTNDGGSDQAPFNYVGIPGLSVRQAGRQDYMHVWHTQFDRYEEAIPEYLVQASTNHAVVSYNLACADTLLPRGPKPKKKESK
jgi:hypothetical protein